MRYFLHIAFDGTRYHGWQRQTSVATTVQQTLEDVLSQILKEKIIVVGCGRTDRGVHASRFIAHIDYQGDLPAQCLFYLHKQLPQDIIVYQFIPVSQLYNARFAATQRTYTYIWTRKANPFRINHATLWEATNIDKKALLHAADLIPQYSDFVNLCSRPDKHNTTICHVSATEIVVGDDDITLTISSNRFLKSMIRKIAYCLMMVGEQKMSLDTFKNYLSGLRSNDVIKSADPQGLYLSDIKYPFLRWDNDKYIFINKG